LLLIQHRKKVQIKKKIEKKYIKLAHNV